MQQPPQKPKFREFFNISRLAIAFPKLTIGFWLAVTVAGIMAFSSLKYALFPDIAFPVVVVNAQAQTQTATATEQTLTQPIEQALRSLPNVDNVRSSSYPGQSAVSLSFRVGTALEASSRAVETAMQSVSLPQGSTFRVIPLNLNESAAVSYAILWSLAKPIDSSSRSLSDLSKLANEQIVPEIAALPGVLNVNLLGEPAAPADPSSIPTAAPAVGTLVRFNGNDALSFQVVKRGSANTLEVVEAVNQEVARLQSTLPDVQLSLAATQADYIRNATTSTIEALVEAIALAIIVIFPFLRNWKATFISAISIPISLLGTFIAMAFFEFNLETITLLALALVVGNVVDDAIVEVENISRHIENGETPKQAALHATDEIGLAVTATTFTNVAVFLPIGLMGGVVGQFFKPFGITVTASMVTSLLVARTLVPVLSLYLLKRQPEQSAPRVGRVWSYFDEAYRTLLRWSLRHRWIVVGIAILSLVGGLAIVPFIPQGFIPKLDRGEFNVRYTAPLPQIPSREALAADPSLLAQINPLQDSLAVAKQLEDAVRKAPGVETIFTTVGSREGEPNKGLLYVKLSDDRPIPTAQVQDQLRAALPQIAGGSTSVEDIPFVEVGSQKPLQASIRGNDLTTLTTAATALKNKVQTLPGFVDVTLSGSTITNNTIQQIDRRDGERAVEISANLGEDLPLGDATEQLVEASKGILPPGVTLNLGGDSATSSQIFSSFGTTLALSTLCIIVALVALFQNILDPLVIALSLPLALIGAMLALLFTRSDFGMVSLIGFVFLLGLANKNAILIVDYISQLRRDGLDRSAAILKAGPIRLRPILMTTASTILGMAPLALKFGAGAELRSPMAVAISGGLITSTLLTLFVIPVVYTLLDDLKPKKLNRTTNP
ncbi:efflux RND transporter permease subunit [Myxacorys almedinensis]|uniref:MMPL family transporter n=1 Tax=Myxacorys almedinensis A TaxID=2690445 RepID=A0A8J7Z659_9CYAN|nr:efflux RND transporter permease subunit [Myxacorys almedinensis]NDJ18803.1 MMPL family transporter [Myxacorys almedinensis A]